MSPVILIHLKQVLLPFHLMLPVIFNHLMFQGMNQVLLLKNPSKNPKILKKEQTKEGKEIKKLLKLQNILKIQNIA